MSERTLSKLEFHAYQDLTRAIEEMEVREKAAAEAEAEYKVKKAKALLKATGPMDVRKAVADIESAAARVNRDATKAQVGLQRERIKQIHAQIETQRTIASTERRIVEVAP